MACLAIKTDALLETYCGLIIIERKRGRATKLDVTKLQNCLVDSSKTIK